MDRGDVDLDVIDRLEMLRRNDLIRASEGGARSVLHEQHLAADGGGALGAVGGHDDAVSLLRQVGHHLHEQLVVGVVQVGGRFIQDKDLGRLADNPGQQDELALSSAERGVFPVGKVGGVGFSRAAKAAARSASLGARKVEKWAERPIRTTSSTV